ncbi:MAG: hypothetical protein K5682_01045 [Lachnospiraceae bacterium]|nr:hypothetical protein [Lachnospiraceae bacterium]
MTNRRYKKEPKEESSGIRSVLILMIAILVILMVLGWLYMTYAPKLRREVTEKVVEQMISGSMGGSITYEEMIAQLEEEERIKVDAMVDKYATNENITVLIQIYQNSDGNLSQIEPEMKKILDPEDMEYIYTLIEKYGKK